MTHRTFMQIIKMIQNITLPQNLNTILLDVLLETHLGIKAFRNFEWILKGECSKKKKNIYYIEIHEFM